MAINELPDEILVRILSFLPRSDRLESSLTCRRWAQLVARAPPLLRDIWLKIGYAKRESAEIVFANSYRNYENLRFTGVNGSDFNTAFWAKVGPNLRKLELLGKWSNEAFHTVLQECCNLEYLEINIEPLDCVSPVLPLGMNLETIQKSMHSLRHLHLKSFVSGDILEYLFILMPNVSSIALLNFNTKSDFLSRLPNLLRTSRRITTLDLDEQCSQSSDDCEQLLRISTTSLQKLRCETKILTRKTLDALLNCTMLRDLDIYMHDAFDVRSLHEIFRNFPELESLSIRDWTSATVEHLMPLFDLRKLRILHINLGFKTHSDDFIPEKFLRELARLSSLETLTLGLWLGKVDSARLRILARLPRLRNLTIDCLHWEAESLGVIVSDLKKLKTLAIRGEGGYDERKMCDQHSELERNAPESVDRTTSDRQAELGPSSLEVLELGSIPLANACLGCITAYHGRLRVLHIWGCHNITDRGLKKLFQHEPLLEELRIYSGYGTDGTFLEFLGELCPRLRLIEVDICLEFSDEALRAVKLRKSRVNFFLRDVHCFD